MRRFQLPQFELSRFRHSFIPSAFLASRPPFGDLFLLCIYLLLLLRYVNDIPF